jgi:hypothetical protein
MGLLLIPLWIRSYSWMDSAKYLHIASADGKFYVLQNLQIQPGSRDESYRFGIISMSLDGQKVIRVGRPGLTVPFWAITIFSLLLAVGPWVGAIRPAARPGNNSDAGI